FPGCNKSYSYAETLKYHERKHTGERPYVCGYEGCDKTYIHADILRGHERTHTGERPFVCEFEGCDKAFTNASCRAKHQKRTHANDKSYHCPVEVNPSEQCTRSYFDPSSLRKHIVTSHNRKAYMIAKRKKAKNGRNGSYGIVRHHEWFGNSAEEEDDDTPSERRILASGVPSTFPS
ncbi:zinc finger protein, partial [Aphelenchoides avenae]